MLTDLKANTVLFAGNTVSSVSESPEARLSLLVALYKLSALTFNYENTLIQSSSMTKRGAKN